jgi:hypothetical protein
MRLARPSSASSLPLAAVCWRRPAGLAPPRVGARHASSSGTPAPAAPSSFDTSVVQDAWDFDADGGLFALSQARAAKAFFREQGFVVFAGVMSAAENAGAVRALIDDLHEVNPATAHITDPAAFDEADLPTSPNHTFRTTCNMAFGRFARAVRGHAGVRAAFAALHGVPAERLACSWDNPFYTPQANDSCSTQNACTQLHWDMNWWYGGEKAPLADELCVQGVYYASPTSATTPAFVCCPGSAATFMDFCDSDLNPSKQGARVLNCPRPPGAVKRPWRSSAFCCENTFCMGLLYGRAGCLTALFGGSRPGQTCRSGTSATRSPRRLGCRSRGESTCRPARCCSGTLGRATATPRRPSPPPAGRRRSGVWRSRSATARRRSAPRPSRRPAC